jgi:hypothetical protein
MVRGHRELELQDQKRCFSEIIQKLKIVPMSCSQSPKALLFLYQSHNIVIAPLTFYYNELEDGLSTSKHESDGSCGS